jgi:BolA protein
VFNGVIRQERPAMGKVAKAIDNKLRREFAPARLEIVDESSGHRGHAGWREGGETHFRVEIVSTAFEGKSRVARQRLVYAALKQEFDAGLHALALTTLTPAEDQRLAS